MRHVEIIEAEKAFRALVDSVEGGEEVVITREGKTVARLVAETRPPHDVEAARAAAERILERSKTASLGGLKIKDLINEGRR